MSAYIVPHNHIKAIVKWAGKICVGSVHGYEQATAELLLTENARSVNYRYQENNPVEAIVLALDAPDLSPIEVIKACQCLDYQSCETEDWRLTKAYQLLQLIESSAICRLPGYEQAEWSIE